MATTNEINAWEEAWSDYVSALDLQDARVDGENFAYWSHVAATRLRDARNRLRCIDAEFCKQLGI